MSRPLLELKGITRRFVAGEKDFIALNDINLTINAGELVAITGASGSGKSTLMNVLGCLDHANSGSYKVDGRETSTLSDDELAELRRDHFGFIFQRYHLLPHLGRPTTSKCRRSMPAPARPSATAAPRNCWYAWAWRGTWNIGRASCRAVSNSGSVSPGR